MVHVLQDVAIGPYRARLRGPFSGTIRMAAPNPVPLPFNPVHIRLSRTVDFFNKQSFTSGS